MTTGMLLDLLLAGLLVATIAYAVLLNRRLDALRKSKDEMRAMIDDFADATAKARIGVDALREAGEQSGRELQGLLDKAGALRDDLNFLIDRGSAVADRLVSDVRGVRAARGNDNAADSGDKDDPAARLRKILAATR